MIEAKTLGELRKNGTPVLTVRDETMPLNVSRRCVLDVHDERDEPLLFLCLTDRRGMDEGPP